MGKAIFSIEELQAEVRCTKLRAAAVVLAVIASAAVAACQYPNCDHIEADRCVESSPVGSDLCTSNSDCAAPSVCDVEGSQQCVQCTQARSEGCTGVTPSCGADRLCHACRAHDDCALSNACLSDGSCAAQRDVAYVDPDGTDNATCGKQGPCTSITKALATGRSYIKLHGTIDDSITVGGGRMVTILADPQATITRRAGGDPVLTVRDDGTALEIYDLTISDVSDNRSFSILVPPNGSPSLSLNHVTIANNAGGGISIARGSFILVRSTISSNAAGGLVIDGSVRFVVVGNVFVANGTASSVVGAVDITTSDSLTNRLEFNTFYKNAAQNGIGTAVNCAIGRFTARNNIMFGNGTLSNQEQVGGDCEHIYSIVRPGTMPQGIGNQAIDPLFKSAVARDVHLDSRSPAIGAADPSADLTGLAERDVDGKTRVSPATLGAYQMR